MHWQHPRFFAYFPTASSFEAILGDLYASGIGSNPGFNVSLVPHHYVLVRAHRSLTLLPTHLTLDIGNPLQ